MDPVTAAWQATGSPRPAEATRAGTCARCLAIEQLTLTSKVVSDNFTGYDHWLNPQGYGLCPPCSWAYTHTGLRAKPHLVRREPPSLSSLGPAELHQALQQPPDHDITLAVPSRSGRKHVLPLARWGRIQLDDTPIAWTTHDVRRLATLTSLRDRGISPTALTQATPSWPVLRSASEHERPQLLAQWSELQPWRDARPWLQLALLATNPR